MALSKLVEQPIKFIREYYIQDTNTASKVLESRWHYDTKKNPYGPILVENFIHPPKEKKLKIKKNKKSA